MKTATHYLDKNLVGEDPVRVDLVGAGGNGSQMLTGLARMHRALQALGHPGLQVEVFDNDVVTDANVGRQLFSPSDVGQFKSTVLVHRINCFFGLNWRDHNTRSTFTDDTEIIIGCVDSIEPRRKIHRSDYTYWLDVGNKARTGQVILGRKPEKHNQLDGTRPKTFFEFFPELNRGRVKEDTTPSCSLAEALDKQDLFINQTVVTFGLNLLWTFLRNGCLTQNGYFINLESGRVVPIPIEQRTFGKPLVEIFNDKPKQKK